MKPITWATAAVCWLVGCAAAPPSPISPAAKFCEAIPLVELPPQDKTTDSSVLEFRIEPAEPPHTSSALRFHLRNVSKETLWVNARMSAESLIGEISIDVAHNDAGEPLAVDCRIHPGPSEYVVLRPGSEISVLGSIGCLEFPQEGPWRLTAHYQDKKRRIPRPPLGAVWFGGTLVSNDLEFHAKPALVPPPTP